MAQASLRMLALVVMPLGGLPARLLVLACRWHFRSSIFSLALLSAVIGNAAEPVFLGTTVTGADKTLVCVVLLKVASSAVTKPSSDPLEESPPPQPASSKPSAMTFARCIIRNIAGMLDVVRLLFISAPSFIERNVQSRLILPDLSHRA
jgi:hypothetical protein